MKSFVLTHSDPDSDQACVHIVQAEILEQALPMLREIAQKDLAESGYHVRDWVGRKLNHLPYYHGGFPVTETADEEFDPDFIAEWYHVEEVPCYKVI